MNKPREFWIEMQECAQLQIADGRPSQSWEELKAQGKVYWQVPTNCKGWITISTKEIDHAVHVVEFAAYMRAIEALKKIENKFGFEDMAAGPIDIALKTLKELGEEI